MDNERKKKLLDTMKNFNKDQKNELLSFGNESEDKDVISTGIKALDKFIGGGTKKGTFTVIYGGQSVGKSTLVLQAIAKAQQNNQICCYIDLEHTFDKERAKSLGINLNDLILAEKCENAEQALEIIRKLCKEKVIDLVVVDSIQAMSPINERENKGKERELASKEIAELARTLSKFFRVVAPDVYRAKASVIMIGQIRIAGIGSFYTHADMSGGEALKHWAYTRFFMRRGQKSDAPVLKYKEYFIDPDDKIRHSTKSEEQGFDTVIKLEKTKSSLSNHEGSEIHIPFLYDKGFVDKIEESKELPIRIEANNEEEKKKIEDYLVNKDIKTCNDFVKEDQFLDKLTQNILNDSNTKIENRKFTQKEKEPLDNPIHVKKRGRPRKDK